MWQIKPDFVKEPFLAVKPCSKLARSEGLSYKASTFSILGYGRAFETSHLLGFLKKLLFSEAASEFVVRVFLFRRPSRLSLHGF